MQNNSNRKVAVQQKVFDEINWHELSAKRVVSQLKTSVEQGLRNHEAEERRKKHGPNTLPQKKSKSLLLIFIHQFQSPLIYILILASIITFALGKTTDSGVILAVLFINALIGTFQEGRAEKSMEALRRLSALKVRVIRESRENEIEASELVPGDILLLAAGDAIGADSRLIHSVNLQVEEAALTGESLSVEKSIQELQADTPLSERRNMVYAGTHISSGRGRAVVVATGLRTEVGQIAAMTEAAVEPKTPLEVRIGQFSHFVIIAAVVMVILVIGIGIIRGISFTEIFMIAISQMVSMVPEGLPVAMTVALAVGMRRMTKRGAIIRQLSAVETLGSTSVIASDKTGTLTKNEMTVTALYFPDGREIEVTGSGYDPQGEFLFQGKVIEGVRDPALMKLLTAGVLCNDSQLISPDCENLQWKALGDPTEAALLTLARKAGLTREDLNQKYPRIGEIPFDSGIKMMATQHQIDGEDIVYIKGAPEMVLGICSRIDLNGNTQDLDDVYRQKIFQSGEAMAERALRLLALAVIQKEKINALAGFSSMEGKAVFLGLIGQLDPPRPEVKEAVSECRSAGIRPVMVTGDHKITALAIARTLGIAREGDLALDGKELKQINQHELVEKIDRISVFARVHPAQKLRIVEAWQSRGAVVAMTGDGVNDAPALAKADVGVAMGITGTEVAKSASKMVITDDNFTTIVNTVEEGRLVYRNIKKLLLYLVSTSLSEVAILFLALILGYPLPLAAVQILWVNLVTSGMMTVPLIMTPLEGDEMKQHPIPRKEPLFTKIMRSRMGIMIPCMTVSTLFYFIFKLGTDMPFEQIQTGTFTVLVVCQWFNAVNCLSENKTLFSLGVFRNKWLIGSLFLGNILQLLVVFSPPLQKLFHTTAIPFSEVFLIGGLASLVFWIEEIRKFVLRKLSKNAIFKN